MDETERKRRAELFKEKLDEVIDDAITHGVDRVDVSFLLLGAVDANERVLWEAAKLAVNKVMADAAVKAMAD